MPYLIHINTNSPAWRRQHPWTPKKFQGLDLYVGANTRTSYVTSIKDAKQYSTIDAATYNKLPYEDIIKKDKQQ